MNDLLYRWPDAARLESMVPKSKIYEQRSLSTSVRDRFVAEVERITWAFKLAEATINLPGNEAIPEIQVFELQTKTDDISRVVLTAIDKTVRTPIVFEIVRGQAAERRIRPPPTKKSAPEHRS